jgi:hypothetical protein
LEDWSTSTFGIQYNRRSAKTSGGIDEAVGNIGYYLQQQFQFFDRRQGYPDAYIAMYHDQGLVAYKMLAQKRGVNVTIGLPTPRTSVDHGTAYDIAGRGIAEAESLLEAYRLGEYLAGRRAQRSNEFNRNIISRAKVIGVTI